MQANKQAKQQKLLHKLEIKRKLLILLKKQQKHKLVLCNLKVQPKNCVVLN